MDQKKKYSTNRYRENHYNNEQPLKKLGRSSKNEAGVKTQVKRHPVVNFFLFLTLVSSLAYFGITLWTGEDNTNFFGTLISSVIFVVFSILFIAICVSNPNRKKGSIVLGSFFLLLFNIYGSLTSLGIVQVPALGQVENFTGKSLTDVVSWASSNDITLNQDYEYSDMVPEYSIISQDIVEGTKIKDIDEITVAVSEGPNPDKEIIVPDMTSWDSERVINYVEDNYLNNVEVSFEESDQAEDTVIEQSESGSMRRSDKLELTFSLGEKANDSDVKIRDLTDMSEFAATFYLKQHRIHYEIERDFSKNINRGHVSEQSVKAGEMVKVNTDDEKVIITISRGRSITIPNLKKMSMVEITEWVIENKLKVEFTNRYDDSVKENRVIEANYDTGEKVEQGTTIEVVISKGSLVMRNFDSLEEFRKWADKYNISYEEKHEFSDDVPEGEIISFSYKKGDTIKNGDSIVVTISDGKECEVPDLIGMSRKEAIDALEEAELNYNFVTQNSNKSKNTVIKQSISAGSNVSKGTTITVTLSNGKSVEAREENSSGNSSSTSNSSSNSSSSSNSNGSSGNGNSNNSSKPTPDPEPVCNSCSIRSGELKNVILNNTGSFDGAANAVRNFITGKCPGVTVNISGDSSSGFTAGSYVSGFEGGSFSSCDTISITLAK